MRTLRFLCVFLLFASIEGRAFAQSPGAPLTAFTVVPHCTLSTNNKLIEGYCLGAISMLLLFTSGSEKLFCAAQNVTVGQGALVVGKFATDHPELLNESFTVFTIAAFHSAWPCSK